MEKHYQVKMHTVQVFVLVARLLGSVMRATTFLWKKTTISVSSSREEVFRFCRYLGKERLRRGGVRREGEVG